MKINNYECFEFSQEDYNEIHNLLYSKLEGISDDYSIADVLMALLKIVSDVVYHLNWIKCNISQEEFQ